MATTAPEYEDKAKYCLYLSGVYLQTANKLEHEGRDADAYSCRENAYWAGVDATYFFGRALRVRNQTNKPGLDSLE